MKDKLYDMLYLQIRLNNLTKSDWLKSLDPDSDWQNAIICEVAEALESTNYKWWKSGRVDVDNIKIELIDMRE